jgi:hypothetical protein
MENIGADFPTGRNVILKMESELIPISAPPARRGLSVGGAVVSITDETRELPWGQAEKHPLPGGRKINKEDKNYVYRDCADPG